MRILLTVLALLITSPAFAVTEATILYCSNTQQPEFCLKSFQAEEQRQREVQRELAEEQTRGMALFGAGFGMMNGMNQAFRPIPPPQPLMLQPPILSFPNAGH